MPRVTIRQAVGRTAEQKRAAVEGVTRAISDAYGVSWSEIEVHIFELELRNVAKGGVIQSELGDDTPT